MKQVLVPGLGEGIVEVRVVQLLCQPGDVVAADQPLYEVETTKARMEIEAPFAGRLVGWLAREGDMLEVGAPIALVVAEPLAAQRPPPDSPSRDGVGADFTDTAISPARRSLNEALLRSMSDCVPAVVATDVLDTRLTKAVRALQIAHRAESVVTEFAALAYLVAQAARTEGSVRTRRIGTDLLRTFAHLDLGVAVTDTRGDLQVAVVRGADQLAFPEFISRLTDAIDRARGGENSADGTVTMILSAVDSDLVSFAIPTVVPPASATLVLGSAAAGGRRSAVLAFDHCVFNGHQAAQFLEAFVRTVDQHADVRGGARSEPVVADDVSALGQVSRIAATVLGRRIEPDVPLAEQGMTSAKAVELAARLSGLPGVDFSPTAMWHHPTARALAATVAATGASTGQTGPTEHGGPTSPTPVDDHAIAIVGAACRLPGAEGLDEFWQLLGSCVDQFVDVPPERVPGLNPETLTMDTDVRVRAALVDRADGFDAAFFGFTPRLAATMDPQQRMLLELSWQALECAAISPDALAGTETGVFIGAGGHDYRELVAAHRFADGMTATGTLHAYLANRLSQYYDLRGPSMTIDTACSSALIAVTQAVAALRGNQCDLVLTGAAQVISNGFSPAAYYQAGMLSPDSAGTPFDDSANGFVRGEGGVVFAMKRLDDARSNGDPVLAVIRGVAVNHGGRSAGVAHPNPAAQTALVTRAWREAGLTGADLGYIEAHGTATALGDPIEIEALSNALATASGSAGPGGNLWVGSVKATIGHLEGAAGAAGLLTAAMVVARGTIPGMPGFRRLNRHLDLAGTPIRVATESVEWRHEQLRRAGVTSLGLGGANAHVVVEQYDLPVLSSTNSAGARLFPISAASAAALCRVATRLADQLGDAEGFPLDRVARTLQFGRRDLRERAFVIASTRQKLIDGLRTVAAGATVVDDRAHPGSSQARQWQSGGTADWSDLWGEGSVPVRIPLPPYPFQRTRHRLPFGRAAAEAATIVAVEPVVEAVEQESTVEATPPSTPVSAPAVRSDGMTAADDRGADAAIVDEVRACLGEVLMCRGDEIDPDMSFAALGLDSILTVEAAALLTKRLSVRVAAQTLHDHPTCVRLADQLATVGAIAALVADDRGRR